MNHNQSQKNIPNDWQKKEVGEIFDFIKTYAISRDNLVNGTNNIKGIGNIHYGDLHATYNSTIIDLKKVSVPLVKDYKFNTSLKDFLIDGDLVMADVSEDYDGIGVTILVHGLEDKKVVGGLHTFVLRDNKGMTNEKFRQFIFRNPIVRNKLQKIANGVSVYGISKTNLSKSIINIPSLPEQKRIVSVLETWDIAIEKLARKIEVKKNIKKSLMQKLLTGKVRLPGFSELWELVKLKSICNIKKGEQLNRNKMIKSGSYMALNGGIEASGYINKWNTEENTITISEGGNSCGFINFIREKFWCGGHCYVVIPNNQINNLFLYQALKSMQDKIMNLRVGSGLPNIQKKSLDDLKINIPKTKMEQDLISEILTKSDKEIEFLQEKLNKLKDQKKYLLNNLITGKIRTPEKM